MAVRIVYTLLSLPMVAIDGEDVQRPRLRAEVGLPDGEWPETVWVRQTGSGSSVLNVLTGRELPDVPTGHREGE